MSRLTDPTFLSGPNAAFIAELYARYLEDPQSVDASWRGFFADLADPPGAVERELDGPGWGEARPHLIGNGALAANGHAAASVLPGDAQQAALDSVRAVALIRGYRVRGHLIADLDPLGLTKRASHPDLDPATYGFTEADYDRPIFINDLLGFRTATVRQMLAALKVIYCGTVGVEYMHMQELEERRWIQARIELPRNQTEFTPEGKRAILERLTASEQLERFLDRRYTGTKRFGLEGAEALIPALEQVIKRGGQLGMQELVIGMPHRGRLNVLTNVMGKPYAALFSEFQGNPANPEDVQGSGDVKYHLGTSTDREIGEVKMHLSLTANPSHLEAVNPVVLGKVRAKQRQRGGDNARDVVVGLLMHGDAAFAGQGLVAESLDLSELRGYRTGGTIHVIVNNQIGFTTSPAHARSSPYPSDVAKGNQAPIFHVNGDDAEAVVHVARIATEFRQRFKKDVVVDIFCYRRHGHNEADEPAFTQPLMYRAIASHPTTREIYAARLAAEGLVSADEAEKMRTDFLARLEHDFEAAKSYRPNKADWLEGAWSGLTVASNDDRRGETAVPMELLREVGSALTRVPENFHLNPKIARQLEQKSQALRARRGHRLGDGRGARRRHAVRRGHVRAALGPGQRPRHVLAAPRRSRRSGERGPLRSLEPRARRPGRVRDRRQPALRGGGARLRIRLQPRRAARARHVGGAVRRFRQRRAGHHRSVHRLGRSEVAAHVGRHCCSCRTATRGRGRNIPRRASSAISSCAARTICKSAVSPRRPIISMRCGARCGAISGSRSSS